MSLSDLLTVDRLSDGSGDPVLVVDFVKFSGDRTLGDLVSQALPGRPVLRADAVADLSGVAGLVTVPELAAGYVDLLAGQDQPALLIGYCSAAPLTMALAASWARLSTVPDIVLVAPVVPARADVLDSLAEIRTSLGQARDGQPPDLPADPGQAVTAISDLVRHDVGEVVRTQGFTPAEAAIMTEQMAARYLAWLNFQLSASVAGHPATSLPARLLLAQDLGADQSGRWWTAESESIVPVARDHLLASDLVIPALQELLDDH
jgi:hypothetical protein